MISSALEPQAADVSPYSPAAVPADLDVPTGSARPAGPGTSGGASYLDRPELPEPGADACPLCGLDPCGCGELMIDAAEAIGSPPAPELALFEWPIAGQRPPGLLAVWRARRAKLLADHGSRACVSLDQPPGAIARAARERMQAVEERLGMRPPSPEQIEIARGTLATVGALLLALTDRLDHDASPARL